MTDARHQGGGAAGTDGDGAAHPWLPAGKAAPPGGPGTGSDSDRADGSDRPAGLRPAGPGAGHATAAGSAQAPASTAVVVEEAPPSAGTGAAAAEQPAPASPAPAGQEHVPGLGGQWRPVIRASAIGLLLLAVVVLGFVGYLYGLSDVQEARSQAILYQQFQL